MLAGTGFADRLHRFPFSDRRGGPMPAAHAVQWDVVRRKLRFTGITVREQPSPHTWRWEQHAAWARELRPGAIRNVAIPADVCG